MLSVYIMTKQQVVQVGLFVCSLAFLALNVI